MEKEVLRLFKGYLGEPSNKVNEEALKYGLLIPDTADKKVVKEAIKQYSKDGEKWNQTFHKSFETVQDTPIETLVIQQIVHYITTYGFESLGIYDESNVYIPKEKLEIPELDKDTIDMIYIKPMTEEEVATKIMTLLTSGIALSSQTIDDIMVLSDFIKKDQIDEIKNREIKIALYNKYGIVPKNPEEFLRYLLFKTTSSTLKIQNNDTIYSIKHCDKQLALNLLSNYVTNYGYDKLSSIFLRNKKLFLAFKIKEDNVYKESTNKIINKLRKLADENHKPLKPNKVDMLTQDIEFALEEKDLDNITIFRELRILNALNYYIINPKCNCVLYRIRNGKSFVKDIKTISEHHDDLLRERYEFIANHLINRLREKVANKVIYIPSNVTYAVPTSEKQFIGNIPRGSFVDIPHDDLVYGVHWTNTKNGRVDLDLKQMNANQVFGWDASYKNDFITFSGDLTDAPLPEGATELFAVSKDCEDSAFLVDLNWYNYNYDPAEEVPYDFVIAKRNGMLKRDYVIDPNDIIVNIPSKITNKDIQKVLGMIVIKKEDIRFYFDDFVNGHSITARFNETQRKAFDYLLAYNRLSLKLNELLDLAGATIINVPTYLKTTKKLNENNEMVTIVEEVPADIDLSLESITKETIIGLLS